MTCVRNIPSTFKIQNDLPLEIHFIYFGNKEMQGILRHAAYSHTFHKMLFHNFILSFK
jgi:hypothetical protein